MHAMPIQHKYTNRLIDTASPYLRQHAHNPVNWYPWGDEAFEKARVEDKPVFLSVGYSACHWCHVMERESFADEAVAGELNRAFISVKVDREERPDVDHFYMQACQRLTGSGGWPLTALLTPDRKPFFAGTYYPKARLLDILSQAESLWRSCSRDSLRKAAEDLTRLSSEQFILSDHELEPQGAVQQLMSIYDRENGGFGRAPKFPSPHNLLLLMRFAQKEPAGSETWQAVSQALRSMARGGLRDHLGGGFCRYSTDARWLVPHFEKMLYDNALLLMAYTEHAQKTGDRDSAWVAHETIAYVMREMVGQEAGLFYTAQDAETEAVEGLFYTFTPEEVRAALGEDAEGFCQVFDIRPQGHLDGRSVPNLLQSPDIELFDPAWSELRAKLFSTRATRNAPFRDEKALLASNALMVAALAKASIAFRREDYLCAAARAARFILRNMRRPDGRLLAVWMDGRAYEPATLDGYAYLTWALIELHQADFGQGWLDEAQKLTRGALDLFAGENGGLYFAGRDMLDIPGRGINAYDGATPSGQSVMAHNLIRLSRLLGLDEYEQRARDLIGSLAGETAQSPAGYAWLMAAQEYLRDGGVDVLITQGEGDGELLRAARGAYRPHLTLRLEAGLGSATAQVCANKACHMPVKTAEELLKILQNGG